MGLWPHAFENYGTFRKAMGHLKISVGHKQCDGVTYNFYPRTILTPEVGLAHARDGGKCGTRTVHAEIRFCSFINYFGMFDIVFHVCIFVQLIHWYIVWIELTVRCSKHPGLFTF